MERIATICGLSILSFCLAALNGESEPHGERVTKETKQVDGSRVGELDGKTRGNNVRTSQLIGMSLHNTKGDELGEINDLVVNAQTGRVQYAAVTYGGFLGVGNKMFAVPFDALQVEVHPRYHERHVLILDISKKTLEGAVGFDQDRWPNFADKKFTDEVDKRYGVDRARRKTQQSDKRDAVPPKPAESSDR